MDALSLKEEPRSKAAEKKAKAFVAKDSEELRLLAAGVDPDMAEEEPSPNMRMGRA